MTANPRLQAILVLVLQHHITQWTQIINYEKAGYIAKHTTLSPNKVRQLLERPMDYPLKDLIMLGEVFGFNEWQTFELVMAGERGEPSKP